MSSDWSESLEELERRRQRALGHGGPDWVASEHAKGRLTARERIDLLLDSGSFQEVGQLAMMPVYGPDGQVREKLPSSFVCGFGRVDGRMIAVGAEDYTVGLGSVTQMYLEKGKGVWPGYVEDLAYRWEIPIVVFLHGVGGDQGSLSPDSPGNQLPPGATLFPMMDLLDRVPSVTAIMGTSGGASAVRATLAHFSLMSREHGCAFGAGPPLVERSLGQKLNKFELGGAKIHLRESGVIDNGADSEADAVAQIKRFLSYMPSNVHELPPRLEARADDPPERSCDRLLEIMPTHPRRVFDPRDLLSEIFDRNSFFEIGPEWARPLVVGLARIGGIPVGILASDCRHSGGAMTPQAADKQTRFVEMCNTFHLPIVYFADVPGLMVGLEAERAGVLRRGARALHAMHRASVPVITLQIRRAFGAGSQATGSPDRLSIKIAWPSMTCGLGSMPVEGGALAAYREEIEAADNPHAALRKIEEQMRRQVPTAWSTAERFDSEDLIDPRETRQVLYRWLEPAFQSQRRGIKPGPGNRP